VAPKLFLYSGLDALDRVHPNESAKIQGRFACNALDGKLRNAF
jgi:hypothetical protein